MEIIRHKKLPIWSTAKNREKKPMSHLKRQICPHRHSTKTRISRLKVSELPFPAVTVSSDRFIDGDYAVKKDKDAPVTETNAEAG